MKFARFTFYAAGTWGVLVLGGLFLIAFLTTRPAGPRGRSAGSP
jgi:hypothetical protein